MTAAAVIYGQFTCACGREHGFRRPGMVPAHMLNDLRDELRGPVHGRLQTMRGMCTDQQAWHQIDAKLREVDELILRAIGDMEPRKADAR